MTGEYMVCYSRKFDHQPTLTVGMRKGAIQKKNRGNREGRESPTLEIKYK